MNSDEFIISAINWPEDSLTPLSSDYNPHELNLRELDESARMSARKDELYEVLTLIDAIKRPTKQVQELRALLMARWDSYQE